MVKLIVTADGSHTLFIEELNEYYHSTFGAIQESMHIFIEAGLKFQLNKFQEINLLEIGFGTGLNALLSYDHSFRNKLNINYWAIEPFPVNSKFIRKLNYGKTLQNKSLSDLFIQLHDAEWNTNLVLSDRFNFRKLKNEVQNTQLPENYFNLVYFDAFAPDVQPELWTEGVFKKIYNSMTEDAVLVTYSVKGDVKRAMKSAGFKIEKLPGPIGKREFLRAKKPTLPV